MTETIGILKDVLIKAVGGSMHDMVQVVNELPKSLLYERGYAKKPRMDRDGYPTGYMVEDKTKPIDVLKDGIKISQTGDGGYVFDMGTGISKERLAELDQFILKSLPREAAIPHREYICIEPGNKSSPPKPRNQFPRVELPVSSPPVEDKTSMIQDSPSVLEPLTHNRRGRNKSLGS